LTPVGIILILGAVAIIVLRRGRKGIGKWFGAGFLALLGLIFLAGGGSSGTGTSTPAAATHTAIATTTTPTAAATKPSANGTTSVAKTSAQPPATATPATWQTVATWKGDATGNTQLFTVANPWRIVWTSAPGRIGSGNFAATVNRRGSILPGDLVGTVIGKGGATSYESSGGTFYLDIQSDEQYAVEVQTNVSALPAQPHYQWSSVMHLSGNSTLNSQQFTVKAPWRIVWTSKPGSIGNGNFAIDVQDSSGSGLPVDSAANVVGTDAGTAYEYQDGTFNLSITADENYDILVQQGS
jgi:hypothetical protein